MKFDGYEETIDNYEEKMQDCCCVLFGNARSRTESVILALLLIIYRRKIERRFQHVRGRSLCQICEKTKTFESACFVKSRDTYVNYFV